MAIDYTTSAGMVRVLVNDLEVGDFVFTDEEIAAYLAMEGDNVKRAAAQAIDTIADNEALASKVYRSQDVGTDGAKVADALRKRAASLRAQADKDEAAGDDGSYFEFVPAQTYEPELTGHLDPLAWWL